MSWAMISGRGRAVRDGVSTVAAKTFSLGGLTLLGLLFLQRLLLLRDVGLRGLDLLGLVVDPGVEVLRAEADDAGQHVRVVAAAQLRALAAVDHGVEALVLGSVGAGRQVLARNLEPGLVVVAGDGV